MRVFGRQPGRTTWAKLVQEWTWLPAYHSRQLRRLFPVFFGIETCSLTVTTVNLLHSPDLAALGFTV
jgi:hypothetical protein